MKNELISLITNKQAHIGVIGLGYVGLPLLVEFTSRGFHGTGFKSTRPRRSRSTPALLTSATCRRAK